jgi:hypothetical protein
MTSQDAFSFVIGPGVQAMMAEFDDEPRSSEIWLSTVDGDQISQTFGRDAIYVYLGRDNRTNRLPFR